MKISGKFSRKSNRDAGGDVTGRQPERLRNTKGSKGRRAEKEETEEKGNKTIRNRQSAYGNAPS